MIELVFDDEGMFKGVCGTTRSGDWKAHMEELRGLFGQRNNDN